MKGHTFNNPIVFVVAHSCEPGLQLNVAVFETEEDAVTAALAMAEERASHYHLDYQSAYNKFGNELIGEWHSLTRHMERIEVFQSPINILQGE